MDSAFLRYNIVPCSGMAEETEVKHLQSFSSLLSTFITKSKTKTMEHDKCGNVSMITLSSGV